MTTRRRPVRAGILNVWEYDSQVFEFGDGRLALRGRNGSGKSNALSLLFPFVLDGVMSAQRMDPMGGARSMRSLLLCRDDDDAASGFRFDSRTGYVWMEFAGETGPLTIGVGATASAQRPDASAWFFVTDRRIGSDLDLEVEGRPRSHRELVAELRDGEVFATAEEFRAAVDGELFGVGPSRAHKLVDLLLVLRRPHLAGKLDPENVSGTLSAGLPSLDATLVADVARSFDDLEATQQELHDLRSSLEVVERFLPVYVEHLVQHVRHRAEELIDASTHLRRTRGQRANAEAERAIAAEHVVVLSAAIDDLRSAITADEIEVEAILASAAYQAIGMLDEVGKLARSAHDHAKAAEDRVATAEGHLTTAEASVASERARLDAAQRTLTSAIDQTRHFAEQAGLLGDADAADPAVIRAFVTDRRRDVAEVRSAIRGAEQAAIRSRDLASAAERAESRRAEAESQLAGTRERVDAERRGLRDALASWARAGADRVATAISSVDWASAQGSSIDVPPLDDLVDAMAASIGAEAGLELAARNRIDPLRHAVTELDGDAARRRTRMIAEREQLSAERVRVSDEPNPGPPIAATRPDAAAAERIGAPLYACVDFASSVRPDERAGWEAALHAAGLLDARLFPDGRVDEALDAALMTERGAVAGSSLAELLVAVPCNGVDVPAIEAVLRSIAIDGEVLSLHESGHWRLGPLSGRFSKPAPEFIGHEAREQRRAARLRQLEEQITALTDEVDRLQAFRLGLREVDGAIDWLLSARPSATRVEGAVADERDALATDEAAAAALEPAVAESERATEASELADGALRALAVRHRLGTLDESLDAVVDSLRETDRAAGEWQHAIDAVGELAGRVQTVAAAVDSRRGEVDQARVEWRRLADLAEQERLRLEVLQSQVGAEAEVAARDLDIARQRHHLEQESKRDEHTAALADSNRLTAEIERLDGELLAAGHRVEKGSAGYAAGCTTEIVEASGRSHLTVDRVRRMQQLVRIDPDDHRRDDSPFNG